MSALDEYLLPFALVYEFASVMLCQFRARLNHTCERCPS